VDAVAVARRLADDVLFPAALETDAADVVPRELLDALAEGGVDVGPDLLARVRDDHPHDFLTTS